MAGAHNAQRAAVARDRFRQRAALRNAPRQMALKQQRRRRRKQSAWQRRQAAAAGMGNEIYQAKNARQKRREKHEKMKHKIMANAKHIRATADMKTVYEGAVNAAWWREQHVSEAEKRHGDNMKYRMCAYVSSISHGI
jgi:hypothetical protein